MANFDAAVSFDAAISFDALSTSSAQMAVSIEIGVPPTSTLSTSAFVLDSGTRGVLDGATYTLADEVEWREISDYVTRVHTRRGMDSERGRTEAGVMTVETRNNTRIFDPANTAGTYYPWLVPNVCRMRATLDGQRIFSGWVDDIAVDHDGNGRVSTVTFTVSDGLARLPDDLTWMPEVEEPGGTRAARLLARAGWGGQSLIVAGSHTMNTAEQSGGVLDQLNALAQGEQGLVYASVDNVLVFLTSSSFVNPSSARTFTDSGSGTYRYASLDEQSSVDVLVTQVEVDYGAAEPLVQGDGEAVSLYGLFTESHQVPFRDESGARAFADQVLAEFAAPVPRFRSMLVPTVRFAQPVREAIFGTDLGTVVTVQRSPLGSGSPTTVSRDCVVVGVEHEISDGGQYAQTGFTLRTVNTATYFTLDSSTLDGSHVLAY